MKVHLIYRSKTTFTKLLLNWEVIGGINYCCKIKERKLQVFLPSIIFLLCPYSISLKQER